MFKKVSLPFLAFIQTTGLVIYIFLIATFFTLVLPNLPSNQSAERFFGPLIMLTLFTISAIISSTLVLGRAAVLFWEKDYKSAFTIILWTVIWGFTYITIFVSYLFLLK